MGKGRRKKRRPKLDFDQLVAEAESCGAIVVKRSSFHWQIFGRCLVNFWPTTGTVYVDSTAKSFKPNPLTSELIIDLAVDPQIAEASCKTWWRHQERIVSRIFGRIVSCV